MDELDEANKTLVRTNNDLDREKESASMFHKRYQETKMDLNSQKKTMVGLPMDSLCAELDSLDDLQVQEKNAFVTVLIDGDCMNVSL